MGKEPFRVGITVEVVEYHQLKEGEPRDKYAECIRGYTVKYIERVLAQRGYEVSFIGDKFQLIQKLFADGERYDLVFNLAEGFKGRNREGEVPTILDIFEIPYIGSDPLSLGLTLDKILAKQILTYHGIPTPKAYPYTYVDGQVRFQTPIDRKVIVKCSQEGSSMGITEASVTDDEQAACQLVQRIETIYHQKALVEEYIEGREFTVMVFGNGDQIAPFPPIEILVNSDHTFIYYGSDVKIAISAWEDVNPQLQAVAVEVFKAFEIRDLTRVDFRVDQQGSVYVLDINPIPSYDPGTHFTLLGEHLGVGYRGILYQLFDLAIERIYGTKECGV